MVILKNFLSKFARIISTIFIPPTITFLFFSYLAIQFEPGDSNKLIAFVIALLFGFVIPIGMFVILRKKNEVSDNDATIREERTKPYLYYAIASFAAAIISQLLSLSQVIIMCWMISGINTLIMIGINFKWKISAHVIGISAPYILLVILTGTVFYWLIPIIVLVAWSRLELKVHTLNQVTAGAIFGIVFSYLQFVIYARLL